MNPMEITAMATVAVGDVVVLLALVSAVLLITFNTIDSVSSFACPKPNQIMISGWLGFLTVFAGLIALTTSGIAYQQIGLLFGMNLGIAAVLLLIALLLLSMGTSWRLTARYRLR